MRIPLKSEVKDEIASMFRQLHPGEAILHDQLIVSNPKIIQAFYLYDYTLNNHKTVPYLRRLCKEVTKDARYGVGHISAMRVPVKVGRRFKRYWAWGYPDKSQGKVVLMTYDIIARGIVRAQFEKADYLGLPTETALTQQALDKAKEEEAEAEAETETEETNEAEIELVPEQDPDAES